MLYSRQKAVCSAVLIMAGFMPLDAKAHDFFLDNEEQLIDTLHTHLYSSSSRLPSFQEFQVAAVCFVTDTSACDGGGFFSNSENLGDGSGETPDFGLSDSERCRKEGYSVTSCAEGYIPGGKKCPYGNYYTECVPACPSNYVECNEPYVGVGEECNGKYASCECTPCGAEYAHTSIPEGYIQDGESCLDCDGQTKYKIKINPCDGFMDCGSMGGEAGAETCLSGDVIKYDNCKPCPNLGSLTSCPTGAVCTYEECSGLWYATGCAANYDYFCTQPQTDCVALGYKQTTCDGHALRCPYNSAFMLCL